MSYQVFTVICTIVLIPLSSSILGHCFLLFFFSPFPLLVLFMALIVDQQSTFKHFCKICKKGFMCGRALGGHMRAHGIGDESGQIDDEEPVSDWEDKHAESIPPANKRMYALRTNPNRCKSTRSCENCGKEFSSWKSFLEHGKCVVEDVESLVSSHDSDDDDGQGNRGGGWSKRKRTMRIKVDNVNAVCPSSEEEDLANCLMMLSNSTIPVEPSNIEPEESCASASRDEERRKPINFIAPLVYQAAGGPSNNNLEKSKGVSRGLFECKACKKVFNSHQALGGHRASHKKVKGCFAAKQDQVDEYVPDDDVITHEEFFPTPKSASNNRHTFEHGSSYSSPSTSKRKSKVHECSICHRVFSSGQALGGHKRCHWITSNSPDTASLAKLQQFHDHLEQIQQSRPPNNKFHIDPDPLALKLDLNVPASMQYELARTQRDTVINPTPLQTGFEFSTEIYLKSWLGIDTKEREVENHQRDNQRQQIHSNKEHSSSKKNVDNPNRKSIYLEKNNQIYNVEDEGDSKVKLAKLSELKDMNRGGSSSSWLQVGIGSTTTTDHHGHASRTIL